jgi:hypothetical protein
MVDGIRSICVGKNMYVPLLCLLTSLEGPLIQCHRVAHQSHSERMSEVFIGRWDKGENKLDNYCPSKGLSTRVILRTICVPLCVRFPAEGGLQLNYSS